LVRQLSDATGNSIYEVTMSGKGRRIAWSENFLTIMLGLDARVVDGRKDAEGTVQAGEPCTSQATTRLLSGVGNGTLYVRFGAPKHFLFRSARARRRIRYWNVRSKKWADGWDTLARRIARRCRGRRLRCAYHE
jgi:hypothetical protein